MEGLGSYFFAILVYVVLLLLFRNYMKNNDEGPTAGAGGMAVMLLLMLVTTVGSAQTHYPLDRSTSAIQVGEVSTIELYQTKDHLIFYNYGEGERWAAVKLNPEERKSLYYLLQDAIKDEDVYKFGIRGSEFAFDYRGAGATIKITDSYNQTVKLNLNINQLKKLFGL
jgi:hypothetical protein